MKMYSVRRYCNIRVRILYCIWVYSINNSKIDEIASIQKLIIFSKDKVYIIVILFFSPVIVFYVETI